jgi:hypothetical protein
MSLLPPPPPLRPPDDGGSTALRERDDRELIASELDCYDYIIMPLYGGVESWILSFVRVDEV